MCKIINVHSGGVIGEIKPYSSVTVPVYGLACDGSAVSRTTYAALFAIVGTTYGVGDGSTTFNVPNTHGVFLRGQGSQTVGGNSYSATLGTATADVFRSHTHTDAGHSHSVPVGKDAPDCAGGGTISGANLGPNTSGTGVANIQATGGSETAPVNLGVNYIIVWK